MGPFDPLTVLYQFVACKIVDRYQTTVLHMAISAKTRVLKLVQEKGMVGVCDVSACGLHPEHLRRLVVDAGRSVDPKPSDAAIDMAGFGEAASTGDEGPDDSTLGPLIDTTGFDEAAVAVADSLASRRYRETSSRSMRRCAHSRHDNVAIAC